MQGRKICPGASGGDKFLLGGGGGSTQARAEDFQIGVALTIFAREKFLSATPKFPSATPNFGF